MISYIEKDRQTEILVERLCAKLKNSENPVEWRNCTFALSQLKFNERNLGKLIEHFSSFHERLIESPEVKAYFVQFISQLRRTCTKGEMKKLIDELDFLVSAKDSA